MIKFLCSFAVVAMILTFGSMGYATPYLAITNQIGYNGTVSYVPDGESETVFETSIPRNGYIYIENETGSDYNIFMSDWNSHAPSNVNDSFFQLYDVGSDSVTSSIGAWNDDITEFSLNVTGEDAVYTEDDDDPENSWSRAWMPDQNTAARGTWTDYEITLTASGMSVTNDSGWYINDSDPASITGSFTGTFVSEARTYDDGLETFENTYTVDLNLSSATWDGDAYEGDGPYNTFGAPVPEPTTWLLFGTGLLGLLGFGRKKFLKKT